MHAAEVQLIEDLTDFCRSKTRTRQMTHRDEPYLVRDFNRQIDGLGTRAAPGPHRDGYEARRELLELLDRLEQGSVAGVRLGREKFERDDRVRGCFVDV